MADLVVKQYTDNILVYKNAIVYLVINRKFNLLGKLTSEFYQEGKLILETGYDIFLFRKFLSIKYQDLPVVISLQKVKGNYVINYRNSLLRVRREYFKNPLYRLYENNNRMGEVLTKINGLTETPIIYNVLF